MGFGDSGVEHSGSATRELIFRGKQSGPAKKPRILLFVCVCVCVCVLVGGWVGDVKCILTLTL